MKIKEHLILGYWEVFYYCFNYGVCIDGRIQFGDLIGICEQILAEKDGLC